MKHKALAIFSSESASSMIIVLVMLVLISSQCALLFKDTRRLLELVKLSSRNEKDELLRNNFLLEELCKFEKGEAYDLEQTLYRSTPSPIISLGKNGSAYLIAKKEGTGSFKIIGKLRE